MNKVTIVEARHVFERMHEERDLRKHPLRHTYNSPPIAALWNQHLRTLRWLDVLDETVKDIYSNSDSTGSQQTEKRSS